MESSAREAFANLVVEIERLEAARKAMAERFAEGVEESLLSRLLMVEVRSSVTRAVKRAEEWLEVGR